MTDLHPSAAGRWRTWPILLSAFAAYSALAVVVTFPLILDLSSRLPSDLLDPLLTASILWWNAHVMPLTERWWNGFGFFPVRGMMAFSEHFLGASLIASPLQWLGYSPITAYNLTFLASFPLCAVAAHALTWTLTKRHDAAIVCGLAYGFNPYRVAHMDHLELLMAFGMPAALAALHLYADTRRARWVVAFAAALTIQALSASYYVLFFTVFLGMWILWFMRPRAWRELLGIAAACSVAALVVSPIVLGYSRIHHALNLTRDFGDVLAYSGDLSSVVTASSLSAVWGWTASLNDAERQLFPGLTITALAVVGAIMSRRSRADDRGRLAIVSNICWVSSACFTAIAIWARVVGPWRLDWGLFPGLMVTALAVVGAIMSRRSRADDRGRLAIVSNICWVSSACFTAIAIWARVVGPWHLDWGWLTVSVTNPYKPLGLSAAFAIFAIVLSPTVRAAFRRRSALAFYLVAASVLFLGSLGSVTVPKSLSLSAAFAIFAIALRPTVRAAFRRRSALAFYLVAASVFFLCSFGPAPELLGEQVLYEPPYAWLMRLPFFGDTVRVPARFAMLGVLALSVAGSLAFHRLTSLTRQRVALLLVVSAGIVADGWIRGLPLPTVPQSGFRIPPGDKSAAVLELPLGDVVRDTAATYRATFHGRRTINGYNGYEPRYYPVLRLALADRDHTALEALASFGPLLIAADNTDNGNPLFGEELGSQAVDSDEPWAFFLSNHPGVKRLGEDGNFTLFHLPLRRPPQDRCASNSVAITAAFDEQGQVDAVTLTDQNPATWWITSHPQRVGDVLVLDLGRVERLCGLVVSMGSQAELYPRTLSVATSFDNVTWETGFLGKMGGSAFRAALENPRDARISVPLPATAARFVRLRIEQSQPFYPWAVADIVVEGW